VLRPLSDAEIAKNWRFVRKGLKIWGFLALALGLWAIWGLGYAQGYHEGTQAPLNKSEELGKDS